MRSVLGAAFVLLAFAGSALADADKLKGYWKLEGYEQNEATSAMLRLLHGLDKAKGDKLVGVLAVQGDKFAFNTKDKLRRSAAFKLDATAKPKTIDLTADTGSTRGTTYLAIYKLDGDELTICIGDANNRPTKFKPAKGQILLQYKKNR